MENRSLFLREAVDFDHDTVVVGWSLEHEPRPIHGSHTDPLRLLLVDELTGAEIYGVPRVACGRNAVRMQQATTTRRRRKADMRPPPVEPGPTVALCRQVHVKPTTDGTTAAYEERWSLSRSGVVTTGAMRSRGVVAEP